MSELPAGYAWLNHEPAPRMLLEAIKLYGTIELPGSADSPTLLAWAKELGLTQIYTHDAIPWCGLYMAICAKRATWDLPENPLWALNWAKWGTSEDVPMLGDVLSFKRQGGGHVAIYVGEDSSHYHILGGNQSDKVSVTRRGKDGLYAARRAPWRTAQPANVRRVFLSSLGTPISSKEE